MSYTPDEARALGQAIADDPESLTMIQVSLQVRGFYSRVEKGAKRFGKRSLTAYIIGTYELVMATQPHRRLEYLAWLMDELLPAVYQDNQVAYEKREQIIDQRRTAKEERGEA
jgi:hypothetical protein